MVADKPLLAICVPTFNRSSYLKKILSSIIPQVEKYKLQEEVIIVIGDNDSTDDTKKMIGEVAAQTSARIIYQKNETNIGAVNNIIKLVENCIAEYLTIFGDDDEVMDDSLPAVIRVLKDNPGMLVFHFKCKQTDFIKPGSIAQKLTPHNAAERFFYNIGNAGTFVLSVKEATVAMNGKQQRIATSCWPQTEIMFLMLMAESESKNCLISSVELVTSESHNDNVIYNTWYIVETFCFSLLRVAQNVSFDYNDPSLMKAAKKAIPGCKEAVKFFFRVILFAAYYDYKYELTKTKELIRDNKKQLKGANYFYPFIYSVLLSLPLWIKKILIAFYFLIGNRSFKKSKFDRSYAEVKEYQKRKFEIYKQKGKLTEDTERYIY